MSITINLNIHWQAPDYIWAKVDEVFKSMKYYDASAEYPRWINGEYYTESSVESSGLQLYSTMPEDIWNEWYSELKEKLTEDLGYEIGEPEDGFEFKYDWN